MFHLACLGRFRAVLFSVCLFSSAIFLLLAPAGCAPGEDRGTDNGNGDNAVEQPAEPREETVRIVYVEWASEIASSYVVKTVIEEKLGFNCELLPVTVISMWESVAAGDQDGMVAAWLPSLHEHYYETHKDQVENLGPNLEGAVMGLVVPEYVPIDSIEQLHENVEEFEGNIIGIDPEAGIMEKTDQVIEEYDLHDYQLITGSDSTMTTTLGNAIEEERWIVVTGWTPHWKFARWDLKYLQDPKGVFGEEEHIGTIVRQGLEEDLPRVYSFLDNFYWSAADMEQVMLWTREEGTTPADAAKRWVEENEELVLEWVGEFE